MKRELIAHHPYSLHRSLYKGYDENMNNHWNYYTKPVSDILNANGGETAIYGLYIYVHTFELTDEILTTFRIELLLFCESLLTFDFIG